MPVQLIASPPASGKTEWLIDTIQEQSRTDPRSRVTVILPAHAQVQQFRKRLAFFGRTFGVEILNLTQYCRKLLNQHRRLFKAATYSIKHHLINESILELLERESLGNLARIATMPGFKNVMFDRFSQLIRSGIEPDDERLLMFSENDAQLAALLSLYSGYWHRCRSTGWMDADWLVAFTAGLLDKAEIQPSRMRLLVVDGFEYFNPAQLRLLKALEPACDRLVISLPLEIGNASLVYERARTTLDRLRTTFTDLEVSSPIFKPTLSSAISALAKRFYQTENQQTHFSDDVPIKMLAVQSPRAEVREGLRWLKLKLLECGVDGHPLLGCSDCVIVSPDEEEYHAILRATALEFGIPLHFSFSGSLAQQPAFAALLNLLQLPMEDYKRRMLLDVIRSPYFDLGEMGLQPEDALLLEIISRKELIMAGLRGWQQALTRKQRSNPDLNDVQEEEIHFNDDLLLPADAERLLAGLQSITGLFSVDSDTQSLTDWVKWMRTILRRVHFAAHNEVHGKELQQSLNELVLVEAEMGISSLTYSQFVQEITSLWQATALHLDSDQHPAVQVLRMPEVRAQRFACVVVHGLAEGILPRVEREDPFLPEDFRTGLGLELQLQKDQAGQFFQLITRADQALLVTRPYLNDKGESLDPSPYWNELVNCIGKENVKILQPSQQRPLSEAASLSEAFFWSGVYGYDSQSFANTAYQAHADLLIQQKHVYQQRWQQSRKSVFNGDLGELIPPLDRMLSSHAIWSASRLEAYLACPMRFWVNYALDAQELAPPEPGLLANQTGSILHEILEKVYASSPLSDLESVLATLDEVTRDVFKNAPEKYNFTPNLMWEIQQEEWLPGLEKTITALDSPDWKPYRFEQKFGGEGLPVLKIVLSNGRTIRIHGTIDRIDRNENGEIRVIDYKTGASHQSANDLLSGTRIQLPIYARAAKDSLGLGEVVEGFYWAILIGKESQLKLSSFEFENFSGPMAAQMVLEAHLDVIIDGIEQGTFTPSPPADNCPDYCGASRWCWQYRPAWRPT